MRASIICLFSESVFIFNKKNISELMEVLALSDSNIYLSRSVDENHDWDVFQNSLDEESSEIIIRNDIERIKVSAQEVGGYFLDANKKLALDFGGSRSYFHSKIFDAVSRIDSKIRRQFLPSEFSISIGWHDVYEAMKSEDGHLFGRASISIRFWGWMHPAPSFEDAVMNLAALNEVAETLEPFCGGKLSRCFYME